MSVEITKAGAEVVDSLRGLWLELHHHHQSVQPGWAYKADDPSWEVRRSEYLHWLSEGGFALLAEKGGKLVGYALVEVKNEPDDTWVSGDRIAHIQTLLVRPGGRGEGLGSRLLDRIDDELAVMGVKDVWINVLPGNEQAIKLYERRGFRQAVIYLARLNDS